MSIATISEVVGALRVGSPVIVVDDEGRENGGDAVMAAQFATQEWIAWMVRHTSGYLCAPMPNDRADALHPPLMGPHSEHPPPTAYPPRPPRRPAPPPRGPRSRGPPPPRIRRFGGARGPILDRNIRRRTRPH